jgi:hypothetical protein
VQISENTTPFMAERTVWSDVEGRDWCIVVVKGTFRLGAGNEVQVAEEQQPFVFADEHHGDPGSSSVRYECDFAPFKPEVDVLFNGHAYAPEGRPAEHCHIRLQVGSLTKTLQVTGSRYWTQGIVQLTPSSPKPFTRVPVLYERAFGGTDHSHKDTAHHGTDLRNPIGTGFRKNPSTSAALGSFLPQVEYPNALHTRWNGTVPPAGLGVIGRGWQPRIQYAGTFDERWRNEQAPFLPEDFNPLHFQSAPADQRLKAVQGGEPVQCINLSMGGVLRFSLPRVEVPVTFVTDKRQERKQPMLDTVLLEPDEQRLVLTWRTRVPLGRKLIQLREIKVGPPRARPRPADYGSKPYFKGLGELVRLRKQRRGK